LRRARNEFDHARWIAGDQTDIDRPRAIALDADDVTIDGRRSQAQDGLEIRAVRRDCRCADRRRCKWTQLILAFGPRVFTPRRELAQIAYVVAERSGAQVLLVMQLPQLTYLGGPIGRRAIRIFTAGQLQNVSSLQDDEVAEATDDQRTRECASACRREAGRLSDPDPQLALRKRVVRNARHELAIDRGVDQRAMAVQLEYVSL